ncbi:hypothetical protein K7G98_13375 [Saccharothrix sp. MB29]|nr:hypothetical protein [Saccharothrix sp. MB29]
MTSNNHAQNRALQQDARKWAAFTGTKYTAALRQMSSPLAQGSSAIESAHGDSSLPSPIMS